MSLIRRDAVGTNIGGIQFKVVAGTTAAVGLDALVPHGLDNDKIDGWADSVTLSATSKITHGHTISGGVFMYNVILDGDNTRIGRFYVDRRPNQIRILDITLIPRHRGKGIGRQLVRRLLDEGKESDLPVRIVLQETESSHSLFKRLGFKQIEKDGPNDLMEWRAAGGGNG